MTYTWPNQPFLLGWYHVTKTNPEKQGWVVGRWDHITMRANMTGSMCSMSLMNLQLIWGAAEKHLCLYCCHYITHKSTCIKFEPFRNGNFLISFCYFLVASPAKIKVVSDGTVLNILNYFICTKIGLSVFYVRLCKPWYIGGTFIHYNFSLKHAWFILCNCNICGDFHHLLLCSQLALHPRTEHQNTSFSAHFCFPETFMARWKG